MKRIQARRGLDEEKHDWNDPALAELGRATRQQVGITARADIYQQSGWRDNGCLLS
jgi:hypothetical protein